MYLIRKFITEGDQETRTVIGYTYDLKIAIDAVKYKYGEPNVVDLITGGEVLYYKDFDKNKKLTFWIKEIRSIQKGDDF